MRHAPLRGLVGQEVLEAALDAPRALDGIELRVASPRTIRGQVVDDFGLPVADADVALQGSGGRSATKRRSGVPGVRLFEQLASRVHTASDGTFRLDGLTQAQSMLHVRKTGLVSLESIVNAGDEDQELELGLEHGIKLVVRVLGEDHARVADATVEALADRIETSHGVTDASGRVELGPFGAPGVLMLRITTGESRFVRGWFSVGPGPVVERVVEAPASRALSVRVLDANGAPEAAARLIAFGRLADTTEVPYSIRRGGARRLSRLGETITDGEGRATFAGLPQDALVLEVFDPEHGAALTYAEVQESDRELEIRLGVHGERVLSGTLSDGHTGLSLGRGTDAGVWLFEQSDLWRALYVRPDSSGRFALTVAEGGEWVGCARAKGYAPVLFALEDEHLEDLGLALFRTQDVRLRFTDRNGLPLSGCVRLEDENGEPVVFGEQGSLRSEASLEPSGEVLLSGIPLRALRVACYPSGAHAPMRWELDSGERSGGVQVFTHDALDLATPRRRVELEVRQLAGAGLADYLGEGRLVVSDASGDTTHELTFTAREDVCLLEGDRRIRELFCDARGLPTNVRARVRDDDDWAPRGRLPGFGGKRARFPLDLVPGAYTIELTTGEGAPRLVSELEVSDGAEALIVPLVLRR